MSNKICTSIEQSKKLLSLGLDPSTADMYYFLDPTPAGNIYHLSVQRIDVGVRSLPEYSDGDLPCWSLTALLELVPVCIKDDNYFFVIEKDATYLDEPIWRVSYKHFSKEDAIVERHAPLINAAFEMVCWLIEQGHIKVNK